MPSYEPVQPYPAPYDAADGGALDASASPPQPRCRQYLSVAMAGLSVLTMGGLCFGFDSCAATLRLHSSLRALPPCAVGSATAAGLPHRWPLSPARLAPSLPQAVPDPVCHQRLLRRLHRRRARRLLGAPLAPPAREVLLRPAVYFRGTGFGLSVRSGRRLCRLWGGECEQMARKREHTARTRAHRSRTRALLPSHAHTPYHPSSPRVHLPPPLAFRHSHLCSQLTHAPFLPPPFFLS
jgi:hypothetical protein